MQANQTTIAELIESEYQDGVLPVNIRAETVEFGGVRLGYFERALQGQEGWRAEVDIGTALLGKRRLRV